MEKKMIKLMRLFLAAFVALSISYSFAADKEASVKNFKWTSKATELRLAMRSLWEDHIFWVRNVMVTTKLGDTGAAKVGEEQVVQNAKEIASAIVPYYGKDAGDSLFKLLAGHYGAVKDSMNAVYSGNKEAAHAAMDKMTKNADEIATFLSSANPNWPKTTLLSALAAHGGYHMAQINAVNAKDFASEAKTWEAMKNQVYGIADVLAEGIVKQFPQKFAGPSV